MNGKSQNRFRARRWYTAPLLVLLAIGLALGFMVYEPDAKEPITLYIAQEGTAQAYTADYVCDGTDDNVQWQAAVNVLPAGGKVEDICGTTYNFSSTVTIPNDDIVISGMGNATYFTGNDSMVLWSDGGNRNVLFLEFGTDSGGVTRNNANDCYCQNIWIGNTYTFEPSAAGCTQSIGNITGTIGSLAINACDETVVFTSDDASMQITAWDGNNTIDLSVLAGGAGCADVFKTIHTDFGDLPVASGCDDMLFLTSSDNSIYIEGNSTTDIINFTAGYFGNITSGGSSAIGNGNDTFNLTSDDGSVAITVWAGNDTVDFSATGSGGCADVFKTVNAPAGTDPVASGCAGMLNLASDGNMTITGDSATDTITWILADSVTLNTDWDADTFLYAMLDDTPVATSPANVLAALTGHATASFAWGGQNLTDLNSIFLDEQAAADADVAGDGQVWVKNDTPNTLWFTNDTGADTQLGIDTTGGNALFGDGSDSDVTISVNTSLTRDMYYNNLTINNGITLNPAGFRIYVKETLTNDGTISRPGSTGGNGGLGGTGTAAAGGSGGSAGTAGVALNAGSIGGTTAGTVGKIGGVGGSGSSCPAASEVGTTTAGTAATALNVAQTGEAGGHGGDGSSLGGIAGTAGTAGTVTAYLGNMRSVFGATVSSPIGRPGDGGGGSGGGGGCKTNMGGGGGGGSGGNGSPGGPIEIFAKVIENNGSILSAGGTGGNGGRGGNAYSTAGVGGGSAGGNGGTGGYVLIVYNTLTASGTMTAAGGTGGSLGLYGASGTTTNATNGTAGKTGLAGFVILLAN